MHSAPLRPTGRRQLQQQQLTRLRCHLIVQPQGVYPPSNTAGVCALPPPLEGETQRQSNLAVATAAAAAASAAASSITRPSPFRAHPAPVYVPLNFHHLLLPRVPEREPQGTQSSTTTMQPWLRERSLTRPLRRRPSPPSAVTAAAMLCCSLSHAGSAVAFTTGTPTRAPTRHSGSSSRSAAAAVPVSQGFARPWGPSPSACLNVGRVSSERGGQARRFRGSRRGGNTGGGLVLMMSGGDEEEAEEEDEEAEAARAEVCLSCVLCFEDRIVQVEK